MKSERDCFSVTAPPGVNAPDGMRPEINLKPTETEGESDSQVVNCGYVPVVLQKMFGPLIFCDLRITAKQETCEWVIERRDDSEWIEVARIQGQLDES